MRRDDAAVKLAGGRACICVPAHWAVVLAGLLSVLVWPAAPARALDPGDIDISDGCMTSGCHGAMLERPKVHTAVADELCDACHVSKNDAHAFEPPADPPELCYECHEAPPDDVFVHGIVADGDCLACHDPHGSKIPQLLASDSVVETCTQCHDNPTEEFEYPHGPAQRGDCLACHEAHYAKHEKLLERTDGDLCLTCHSKSIKRADGPAIRNIGQVIKTAKRVHGPVNFGECLVCHGPHGGVSRPSLRYAFPVGLYSAYSNDGYLLCFQCHDEAMVTEEQSTETGFRNGTRNLHFVHVNRAKGRSCRICHDPHGTDESYMLRESVSFGTWQFPLRFKEGAAGASCWPGCHRELKYDRGIVR